MQNGYAEKAAEAKEREYKQIRAGEKRPTDPASWRPAAYAAVMPDGGVSLHGGMIKTLFDNNVKLILQCMKMEDFCEGEPLFAETGHGWSHWLPASNDGRLLGGAAGALLWEENAELRAVVDRLIEKIKKQMREDGYYNYYPEADSFACIDEPEEPGGMFHVDSPNSERKNYDRVFWTRGMIAAAKSGNRDALPLLRRMYDWFNAAGDYLPLILRGANATNGLPGGPLMYHTELGKPEDIATNQRWFDQDYWMEDLKNREPEAYSLYPGNRPHCYDLLELEALADEYRATGEKRYLDALLGGWDIYADGYKHVGGATAICEADGPYPYRSYYLTTGHNGETCGSVFWVWINGRLLQLYPNEEKYAAQIEEAIFNILLSCRTQSGYTRYHNRMQGVKEAGCCANTCCEVSSTMLISELPRYIYMTDGDGAWVNLFIPSALCTGELHLKMETDFPRGGKVRLTVLESRGEKTLRIRIPSWAGGEVVCRVNDEPFCKGTSSSYAQLRRCWAPGDVIELELPIRFTVKPYEGRDAAPDGKERFALLYGPILMALTGDLDGGAAPKVAWPAERLPEKLIPEGDSLHFSIEGQPALLYKPYFEVDDEVFNCFPEADS